VTVDLREYRSITDHARDAVRPGLNPGDDVPGRHHRSLHIDRAGADENREQSNGARPAVAELPAGERKRIAGRRWREELQREEWPMALSSATGAGVPTCAASHHAEKEGSGSRVGHQLADYCDGVRFRVGCAIAESRRGLDRGDPMICGRPSGKEARKTKPPDPQVA
jgi:hypothetical protein